MPTPKENWIRTDFNGFLEEGLLYLAHSEDVNDVSGRTVHLRQDMAVTAFDLDADEDGKPDRILVTGNVERSPEYAQCNGSVWSLRVDDAGVQWESQFANDV